MRLSSAQNQYLEHELLTRGRPLIDEYYAEKDRFRPAHTELGISKIQLEDTTIRTLAANLIEVRANTFIEIFRKYGKFPDDEDYKNFIDSNKPLIVDRMMQLFEEHRTSLYDEPCPDDVIDAHRMTLSAGLQTIFTNGLRKITSFYLEGRAEENYMEGTFSEREMTVLRRIYKLSDGHPGTMIEIEKLAAQMGILASEVYGYIDSLEKKGYLGGIDEAVWIEADGIREIEDERPKTRSSTGGQTTNFHIHAPVGAIQANNQNSSQNVSQSIQLTNNPDFDAAMQAIAEFVKASSIPEADKTEVLGDLATVSKLALEAEKPGIAARALAKIASIDTILKLTPLAIKVAEYWPAIKAHFE